jgi:hypothetical protein
VPPRGLLDIYYHIRKEKARGIIPAQQEQRAEFNLAFSDGDLQFQYFHMMNTLQTQLPQPLLEPGA